MSSHRKQHEAMAEGKRKRRGPRDEDDGVAGLHVGAEIGVENTRSRLKGSRGAAARDTMTRTTALLSSTRDAGAEIDVGNTRHRLEGSGGAAARDTMTRTTALRPA